VAGAVQTGNLRGATMGGITSLAFLGVASAFKPATSLTVSSGASMGAYAKYALASGMTGGILSKVQGGRFGNGFVTAGASAFLSTVPEGMTSNPGGQAVIAAVIGGTVSDATGGNFGNGAVTAAFSYAVGRIAQSREPSLEQLTQMSTEDLQTAVLGSSDAWLAYEDASALATWSGAAAGADAAQYWADLHVHTGNPAYAVPGAIASLWTPDTAVSTALTLTPAGAVRTVGGWGGRYLFGKGAILNSGRYFRVGLGRDGGNSVVRVAGESLGKVPAPIRNFLGIQEISPGVYKWDIWNRGPL